MPTEQKAPRPERATVTFEGLIKEFGETEGSAKYYAIANLEGEMVIAGVKTVGRYFFDPDAEGPRYRPELLVATLPPDARRKAAEIITTPQVKE